MVLRDFCKKVVLAGFAAEAQRPVLVADKTKPSPTGCAAIFQLGHELLPPIWKLLAPCLFSRAIGIAANSVADFRPRQRRALPTIQRR